MQLSLLRNNFISRPSDWHIDLQVLLPVLALISIGLVMIASASFSFAEYRFGDELFFVKRHLAYLVLAGLVMGIGFFVGPDIWANYGRVWLAISVFLLVIVLIPGIGLELNGSRRWLSIAGFTFQVSEAVKIAVVVFLAAHLAKHRDTLADDWHMFLQLIGILALLELLLILEPDFGSMVLVGCTFMALLFLGGSHIRQFILVAVVAGTVVYWLAESAPYRVARITAFMDPWSDPFNSGYQLTQSLIAFGRGEWFGVGLGQSVQKMLYLPEAHTDFVFAIFAEEFGYVGVICLLGLYSFLVLRILQLAMLAINQRYWYAAYTLIGFSLLFAGQTFINLGVNSGLLPTKGLTLPFVSYGGSSLMSSCAMVGMILRFSHQLHRDKQPVRRSRNG